MAVALLKETINRYITEGSAVYACFLDLSKALERATHAKLLNKLSDRPVPEYLIKLLRVMFTNSSVSVMYNNVMSNKWSIKRGVRQGAVLSAFLFCIYVDDILKSLAELGVGCKIGINNMNIQAYAYDMVLLSPIPCGLRKLLSLAANLIEEADLILNVRKNGGYGIQI